jgi:hypothetical protein
MNKIWNNICHWPSTLPSIAIGALATWLLIHDHITQELFWTILGVAVLPILGIGKKKE